MQIVIFSTRPYDRRFLDAANRDAGEPHDLRFLETTLNADTASAVRNESAVCVFVNDNVDAETLKKLADAGVRHVLLRCAGFNNVDLDAAQKHGISVARVPAYSPHGVAEHAVALMLGLNRRLHKAYARVRENNFNLEGLLGFEMHGKTAGVVGTGHIGRSCCRILLGMGMTVLASDIEPNADLEADGVKYVDLDQLLRESDVVSLHAPLVDATHHLIDAEAIEKMKDGAMLINTSRGGLIDTKAVIGALKNKRLGSLGIDVYEEEDGLFFGDHSAEMLADDQLARLLTFPNVLVTGHQAFFTEEAMRKIAETTIQNATDLEAGGDCENVVKAS